MISGVCVVELNVWGITFDFLGDLVGQSLDLAAMKLLYLCS